MSKSDSSKSGNDFISHIKGMGFAGVYSKYGTILIFIGIFIIASLIDPVFLTGANLVNVLKQLVVVSLLAFGVTFVIILGHIDVSLGSVVALTGTMAASIMHYTQNIFVAVLGGLALGIVVGFANGYIITKFNIPAFIMTLAMTTIARGTILLYTGGRTISGLGNFKVIGQDSIGPVPISVIILLLFMAISWVLLNKTKFGRQIYAVGGNERAAQASGINTKKVVLLAFIFNGILTAVAGIVFMSRINSGQPGGAVSYEFDAITAVVVGGTSLSGGTGTVVGTLLGAMIIGVINNLLNLMNVSSYWQQIVKLSLGLLFYWVSRTCLRCTLMPRRTRIIILF
ncbi:MAG TPA: ABC transporter permease [Clostridiales bacterium]|nr:ABC transporter permease [Clostridiales bacterium]